jgi:hypothetical protein
VHELDGVYALRRKKQQTGFQPRSVRDQIKHGWHDTNGVKRMRAAATRVRQAARGGTGRNTGTLDEMATLLRAQNAVFADILTVRYAPVLRSWAFTQYTANQRFEAHVMAGIRSIVPDCIWSDPACPITPVIIAGDAGTRGPHKGFGKCRFTKGPRIPTNRILRIAARVCRLILSDEFRTTR